MNVGVVGCGKIAERHLNAYRNIEGVNIISVCDINDELRKEMASRYNVLSYRNYREMFKNEDIDSIDVCVPTMYHHEVILEALDNGKTVFCEKPLTHRLEYAEKIRDKQKETRKKVMVGYLYRFHPSFQRLKKVLDAGIIGKPYFSIFRVGGRGNHRVWKHKKGEGGGALLEMMVHMIDLACMYFVEFDAVETLYYNTILKKRIVGGIEIKADAEDCVIVGLKSKDGCQIFCEADLISPSYMNSIEVHGDNGSFFGSILHYLPTIVYCKEARGVYDQGRNVFENTFVNLVEKELRYFISSLSENLEPLNYVEDSIRVLKIIEEIRKRGRCKNL